MTDLRSAASQAASTEVATQESRQPTLRDLLKKQEAGIARALPAHVPAGSYMRAILTDLSRTPKLLQCTPASFFGAIMTAAQLGLTPGPALGEAYLVPYGSTVQLIVGYRGYLALARKSGFLISIAARERCQNDVWEFEYGLDEKLRHIPAEGDRGTVLGYYGIAQFKDGGHLIHYMTVGDINARRARSKAKDDGPWKTDYDAMARKTVIRAMAPWLPQSSEMAQAYEADGAVLELKGDNITPNFVETDDNIVDVTPVDDKQETSGPPVAANEGEQTRNSASSQAATNEQVNDLVALLETAGIPSPDRKTFVQEVIGRNIRGFTTLTVADLEKVLTALEAKLGDGESVQESNPPALMEENTLKRLQILFKDLGITDRGIRMQYITDVIGHPVETSKELTEQEARRIIAQIESELRESQPDPLD